MDDAIGFPRPGSLGCCAYCGSNFLMETITGGLVRTFSVEGIAKPMAAHEHCFDKYYNDDMTVEKLPDGPLKRAYQAAIEKQRQAKSLTEEPKS